MQEGQNAQRAREASGALWGGAVANLGQAPAQIMAQHAAQIRQQTDEAGRQQDLALGAERLKRFQDERMDADTMTHALTGNISQDPASGHVVFNQDRITQQLATRPQALEKWMDFSTKFEDHSAQLQKGHLDQEVRKNQMFADTLGGVLSGPADQQASTYAVRSSALKQLLPGDPLVAQLPAVYDRPQVQALHDSLLTDAQRLTRQQEAAAEYAKTLHDVKPGEKVVRVDPITGQASTVAEGSAPPKHFEQKSVLLDGKPAEVHFDPETGKHYDASGADVSARVTPTPPASMTINPAAIPSAGALDMAAQRYLATGELPPMGMGSAGAAARVAIMNRAATMDPTASLAANKATYKADAANLTKLQTTEGTLSAFEKTAGKNLQQFLTLADQIPDTGVPWLNTPVRLLTQQMVGGTNMAAITAARDVALREIARVTNDPKLSGALTDSARAEVAGLLPANATLPQIKAVAKVLMQDMANVHQGLNAQIATVKSGLSGHPGAPAETVVPANVAKALKGAAPGKHTLSDGSVWLLDANGTITK